MARMPFVTALALAAALAGCGAQAAEREAGGPRQPNIVLVLADDLDWTLLRFMPEVRRLQRDGATLERFYVADSLCCTSRASMFAGQYPHNTHVRSNVPPTGGFAGFREHGGARRSFAVGLSAAGYRTGLFGKYLNGYPAAFPADPGWSDWLAGSDAYHGYDYDFSDNGTPVHFGAAPEDYATDVIARAGDRFVRDSVAAGAPFMVQLSTFTPHLPTVPAPRHAQLLGRARLPVGGAFGRRISDPPRWLGARHALSLRDLARLRERFRQRARSVLAIDEMLGRIRATLAELGVAEDTYVAFTSDNGYHLGHYRLMQGKRTAYEPDIRVPFVIAGPGVPAGSSSAALAANIDLAPTFLDWAGTAMAGHDGRSLARLLRGREPRRWRRALLIEHHENRRERAAADPDTQGRRSGKPGSYEAVRSEDHLYVEHHDGSREFYDLRADPYELANLAGSMSPRARERWHTRLARLRACTGHVCRRADRFR
ncbi:MAG: sulfatase [Solirubrobacteraceae bacterium]